MNFYGQFFLVDATASVKMTLGCHGVIIRPMIRSAEINQHEPLASPVKAVSVHRAFAYSASAPGLGEFYAGRRIQGLVTGFFFLAAMVWFSGSLYLIADGLMDRFMAGLEGRTPAMTSDLPLWGLATAFGALYLLWLWAIIAAVNTAGQYRCRHGLPAQTSVFWAVAISWVCPGAGHVYTGSNRYGYMLFAANLLALVLLVPAYLQLYQSLSALIDNPALSPNNPYKIIGVIHELMLRLDYSFGSLFQASVRYTAIAGAIVDLRQGPLKEDDRWIRTSMPYGLALLGLGWLCPGSGQLLQKRYTTGWTILAVYIGSKCVTGFLLAHDFIAVSTADTLEWASMIIQWGAMLEAVLRMKKMNVKPSRGGQASNA